MKPYLIPVKTIGHTAQPRSTASDQWTLPSDEPLAAERTYSNPWTILPCEIANLPCDGIKPASLLRLLNMIFDTDFTLTSEAKVCLSEFLDDGCDLGTVYGYLRPWWHSIKRKGGFDALRSAIRDRMQDNYKLRAEVVVGSHITKPNIPPRRVWDLYANRVLPYHAMKPATQVDDDGIPCLPNNLWAVSHSWRPPSERQSVQTTINGKAWRVPIPKGTTLNTIRDELLILGAEYVFLDVLCLRQKDDLLPEMEGIRKREWRLDIPTIGHVYNEEISRRPIVVYFNGLGLPFQDAPFDPTDSFHWFKRIWTLQETPYNIIFGGLQRKQEAVHLRDSSQRPVDGVSSTVFDKLLESFVLGQDLTAIIQAISSRTCSNPVDEVASLAYLLRCPKLPIYDADMDVEVAWSLLVECFDDEARIALLCSNFSSPGVASSTSWPPTWQQVKGCRKPSIDIPLFYISMFEAQLQYLDGSSPSSGYKYGFDAYYHEAFVIEGCYIYGSGSDERSACVRIPSVDGVGEKTFEGTLSRPSELVQPDVPYLLISISGYLYWVVAQVVGSRRVDSVRGLEVSKLSIIEIPGMFDPNPGICLLR